MPFLANPKREAFAQAYVRGATAGRRGASYRAAGYKSGGESAFRCAWRLMKDPRVTRRIAELQRGCAASPSSSFIARGDPMPCLSHPKHEAFAQAFVRGETAGSRQCSYLAAGYNCTAKSAKAGAWRLAKDPRVMRRIAELRQDMQEKEIQASEQAIDRLAITKEAVLGELARIAFANMLDYVRADKDGRFDVDLANIDRDMGAAIQEVVVTPMRAAGTGAGADKDASTGAGADKDASTGTGAGTAPAKTAINRIRLKLADKRAALVDLGRHFGLFVGRAAADDYADLGDDELAARIRDVVGQLQRLGIDVRSLFGIGEADLGGQRPARPD